MTGHPFYSLARRDGRAVVMCGDRAAFALPDGDVTIGMYVELLLREDPRGRLASEFLAGLATGVALAAFEGVCVQAQGHGAEGGAR